MKFGSKDLKRLRLPLAACAVLLILAAASYTLADKSFLDARQQSASIIGQRKDMQARLASTNEEEREIRANLQQYQALAARGVIGEENRLDWIDTITAIKNERRLFSINYSIEPQKDLDYPGFAPTGAVKFVYSRAKLEIQLLHEEDLLNFIDDLTRRSKLQVSVRSCNIHRTERSGTGAGLAPRLQADCVFDLITIRLAKPA